MKGLVKLWKINWDLQLIWEKCIIDFLNGRVIPYPPYEPRIFDQLKIAYSSADTDWWGSYMGWYWCSARYASTMHRDLQLVFYRWRRRNKSWQDRSMPFFKYSLMHDQTLAAHEPNFEKYIYWFGVVHKKQRWTCLPKGADPAMRTPLLHYVS